MTEETSNDEGPVGEIGAVPTCENCGSEDVVRDAWATWNPETGLWELKTVFDECACDACGKPTSFVWRHKEEARTARIRALNDQLRTTLHSGTVLMTRGISSFGEEAVRAILKKVRAFDNFTADNDPHGEHDFGAFAHGDHSIFWKIDYFDRECTFGSENPADPEATTRVLTIMLAEEY